MKGWWRRWRDGRRELDEEIEFHLDSLMQDLIEEGWEPADARREAIRRFGNPEHVQERWREEAGLGVVDEGVRNVRFALRGLRQDPLHAATFIITTAVTVALGGLAWGVGDATLWRDLPWPEPDRLVQVAMYDAEVSARPTDTSVDGATWEAFERNGPGYPAAVYSSWGSGVNLGAADAAAFVTQQRVGAGYFEVLGADLLVGREFTEAEDIPGGPALVILSHTTWTEVFGGDRRVLDRPILLKGEPHQVVGIVAEGFRSPIDADVWTPLRPSPTGEGSGTNYTILARLPAGLSIAEAHASLASVPPAFDWAERPGDPRFGLVPHDAVLEGGVRTPLGVLLTGIAVMLLIGWSNLAGVQLARTLARSGEFRARRALGADHGVLVRQTLTETGTAAVLGGALGALGLVALAPEVEALVRSRFGAWQPLPSTAELVAAAAILTLAAAAAAGVIPVLRVLRDGSRTLSPGSRILGRTRHAGRRLLLAGQLGLVTVLVFSAGVLARGYGYLDALDAGFEADGLVTVQYSLDDARYSQRDAVVELFERSVAGLEARPEVDAAAVALTLPYERPLNMPVRLPRSDDPLLTNLVYVTPGFFEVMGIEVRRGRVLDARDRGDAPTVLVANQAFVDRYLPEGEAVGARVSVPSGIGETAIVGVVGNVQQAAGWGGESRPVWETPTLYVSAHQVPDGFFGGVHIWFAPSWIVRGAGATGGTGWGGGSLAEVVLPALGRVVPELPVARVATMSEIVDRTFARQRLEAAFLLVLAGIALLLAGIGLYGLVAQEVTERRGEMGVRIALGASPGRAVLGVGAAGLGVAGAGIAVGLVLSLGVSRLLASLVWGVGTLDPLTLTGVLGALLALAGVASFVPASSVARLDPARVLRDD